MTPAIDLLKRLSVEHRLHSYEHDPKSASYGLEVVEKLKVLSALVYKTLLVSTDREELIVGIVPVTTSLDLKALAQVARAKRVTMADPMLAQRATGYLLGGISPLGQKKRLRTYLDESAQALPTIYVSGGRRGLEVEMSPSALADITGAVFAIIGR